MKRILTFFSCFAFLLNNFSAQVPTNGLVAFYPFSGNANDMSGNSFNGTTTGGPTLTTDRFGISDNAYSFDGTNDYIDLSSYASNFNFQEPATISVWIKSSSSTGQAVYSISDGSAGSFSSMIAVGNASGTLTNELALATHYESGSSYYIAGYTNSNTNLLFDNAWHHLVFTFDSISTSLFLDSKVKSLTCNYGSNNGNYGNIPNASKAAIGARFANSFGAFFNGAIDDFRIYNRVLNSSEISELFHESICFENIAVTDTLFINANLTGFNPVTFQNTIRIYPNPTNDHITIDNGNFSLLNGYTLKITNSLNQQEFLSAINQQIFYLDITSWSGLGIYYVHFIDDLGNTLDIKKIVLQ